MLIDRTQYCDMNCEENCPIYHNCYQKRINQLSDLLDKKWPASASNALSPPCKSYYNMMPYPPHR